MASTSDISPLNRGSWVWARTKWPILLGVLLPAIIFALNEITLKGGGRENANPFLLVAALAAIPTLWLVSPLVISYVHSLIQATDKTSGALMGLAMLGSPVLMVAISNFLPKELLSLSPSFIILGICGFFGMLRTAGPRASIVEGSQHIGRSPSKVKKYFEAAAFSEDFRPTLINICAKLVEDGHQKLALDLVEHLTRVAPREADNWCARSYFAYRTGSKAESFEYLGKAIALEPKNAEHYYNRAVRRSNDEKHYELSLEDYTKAITLDNSQARYLANRAALYNRMGRHESALSDARKANQLHPSDPVAKGQAAVAVTKLGREDQMEDWMGGGAGRLAEMLQASQGSDFSEAVSQYLVAGDGTALKTSYEGESIITIGPDGIQKINVDDL